MFWKIQHKYCRIGTKPFKICGEMAKKNTLEVGNPLEKCVKIHCIRFVPFLGGVANFNIMFLSHFYPTWIFRSYCYPLMYLLYSWHCLLVFHLGFQGFSRSWGCSWRPCWLILAPCWAMLCKLGAILEQLGDKMKPKSAKMS